MEDLIGELVKEVPALGGLVFIVVVFLRHLATRDKVIRDIASESNKAIRQNTQMLGEVTAHLRKLDGKS